MPGAPFGGSQNPLLSGLFGVFQQAAEQHYSTQAVWQALRQSAGTYAYQVSGEALPSNLSDLEARGAEVLRSQGVDAVSVGQYRQIAGNWLAARENLGQLDTAEQITGNAVFTPPWSTTYGSDAVPDRYRIRVNWEVQVQGFTQITRNEWATYELTGPLTSIDDAIAQAQRRFAGSDYNATASVSSVLGYEIEQV